MHEINYEKLKRYKVFKRIVVILAIVMFLTAADISAQDVLMNSAETINNGNFKAAVFSMVLFGRNGSVSVFGVAGRAGFGITSRFDIEAKAAHFIVCAGNPTREKFWQRRPNRMNSLFVQNVTPSDILQTILTFIYFLAHQIGLGIVKVIQAIFTGSTFPTSIIDSIGFLIILTLFIFLIGISKKIAWIIVSVGWILLFIRILMIIFKIG